jgi:hypothetical protein
MFAVRRHWDKYYEKEWLNGIIFVIDAADPERFTEAKHALDVTIYNISYFYDVQMYIFYG